jgi:hypothetical protein
MKGCARLMRPVVAKFVAKIDDATATGVKDFGSKITHWQGGSGISIPSGWLTAFCILFNNEGSLHYRLAPTFDDAWFRIKR